VDSASDEKIFLEQAKFAAGCNRVGRIEHLRDGLGEHLLLDRFHVIAGVENLHVEFVG
jgi:hypothetical protein